MSVEKRSQEMSFFDHLEELRWAILKSVIAVLVGMVICFMFSADIIDFLIAPTKPHEVLELQFIRPSGMFMIMIYISLGCGLVVALPVLLYQIWQFVAPGLMTNERKYVPHVVFFSTVLFLLGSGFAHYILIPILINFMLFIGSGVTEVKAQWDISMYMSMVVKMILIMGAVFQMPILVAFLTWIRILSPTLLKDSWRYAMVIIFILAAVITPTGDPLTQIIVAIPLLVLYVLSVFVSWMIARNREEPEPAEDEDVTDALAPEPPENPTVPRPLPDYTQPGTDYMGGEYWDDEYVFEYDDEMANSEPGPPAVEPADDSESTGEDQMKEEASESSESEAVSSDGEEDTDTEEDPNAPAADGGESEARSTSPNDVESGADPSSDETTEADDGTEDDETTPSDPDRNRP